MGALAPAVYGKNKKITQGPLGNGKATKFLAQSRARPSGGSTRTGPKCRSTNASNAIVEHEPYWDWGRGAGATGAAGGLAGTGARMPWPEVVSGVVTELICVPR